jgi:hypothetical protein
MTPEQIRMLIFELLAYGGGVAAIAYLIFQFLGKSWIESRFAQSLEQFRHQQALEVQRLRVEIDSLLSGALKLQEKEFETLPEAWNRLDEAYGHVSSLVSPGQSYPNLDRLTSEQLEEFLKRSELYETQKQDIRRATQKVLAYQEAIFWHRLHDVKSKCRAFHIYVVRFGIFFPPELKEKLMKVADELWSAVTSKEIGKEAGDYKIQNDGWRKVKEDVEPLYKAIEKDIHARLQAHGRRS